MKLARYEIEGTRRLGLIQDSAVIDLSDRLGDFGDDMLRLIREWDLHRKSIERMRGLRDAELEDVRLLAPLQRPGKILGLGLNYGDHIEETGRTPPDFPTWFSKAQTSIIGPDEAIEIPIVSDQVDYEAELVFIVGKGGRHILEQDAQKHIFGYCCGNDVSVRDWQRRTGQFTIGKSFDTHAPLGPWIVTADEIDASDLDIRCSVNGQVRQNSNTRHQIFKPAFQLANLSQAMTMEPGDTIFTGTPGGVGAAFDPPKFLKVGDTVRVSIEGIGSLENPVVEETL